MFDEQFVNELPQDGVLAGAAICNAFFEFNNSLESNIEKLAKFESYLGALALAEVFISIHNIESPGIPTIRYELGKHIKNIARVVDFFTTWNSLLGSKITKRETESAYEHIKNRYASILSHVVIYEFSDDDFNRVQKLINKLRDILSKSEDFEAGHRRRLLKRLEKLQAELNKKMSDLDSFWGFFVDAGIALGKFWKEAEPFAEGVKEILQIVCRTQAKAENVEKMLPLRLLKGAEEKSEREKS
jgi:hypothetical protein